MGNKTYKTPTKASAKKNCIMISRIICFQFSFDLFNCKISCKETRRIKIILGEVKFTFFFDVYQVRENIRIIIYRNGMKGLTTT